MLTEQKMYSQNTVKDADVEAIILAGGKGTRLQSVINDIPKSLAPINGEPFLKYLFEYLKYNEVHRVILAIGYMAEKIRSYMGDNFKGIQVAYSIEDSFLGTGGAIKRALTKCCKDKVFILNGDTFFDLNLLELEQAHINQNADITISLKEMKNFDRYGVVKFTDGKVTSFEKKQPQAQGYINGGIYCVNKNMFSGFDLPESFSFEEFLSEQVQSLNIHCLVSNGQFIDIGIPEDYITAQVNLVKWTQKYEQGDFPG